MGENKTIKEKSYGTYTILGSIIIAIIIIGSIVYYDFCNRKESVPNEVNKEISELNTISTNINNDMVSFPNISSDNLNTYMDQLLLIKGNLINNEKKTKNDSSLVAEEKLYEDFATYSYYYCELANNTKSIFSEANGFKYNNIVNTNNILALEKSVKEQLNSEALSVITSLYNNNELKRVLTYTITPQQFKDKLSGIQEDLTASKNYEEVSNLVANTESKTYKSQNQVNNSKEGYAGMNLNLQYELNNTPGKINPLLEKIYKLKVLHGTVGGTPVIFDFSNSNYKGGNNLSGIQIINGVKDKIYLSESQDTIGPNNGIPGISIAVQSNDNSQEYMYSLSYSNNTLTGQYTNFAELGKEVNGVISLGQSENATFYM